eukprot:GFYU01058132.1.p1 GENE.GFYU01058132.1~~GFYU01058132.1.p1  ORF type:complete len:125 (-),score=20.13 GFYU01058132.1:65-439(-)
MTIIYEKLVDDVLEMGRMVGALGLFGIAGYVSHKTYGMAWNLTFLVMIFGLLFGYMMLSMSAVIVEIACSSLYVCLCSAPHHLADTQPQVYDNLIVAWEARHDKLPAFLRRSGSSRRQAGQHKV